MTKMHRSKPGLTERFRADGERQGTCQRLQRAERPDRPGRTLQRPTPLERKGRRRSDVHRPGLPESIAIRYASHIGHRYRHRPSDHVNDGRILYQEVLFFPQMRPEKRLSPKDAPARYTELGIPEDWVAVIQKAGYNLVSDMKDVNPQKLHMDICGINKKYKLNWQTRP